MSRTLFVTGTDTGVGKTRVACALLGALGANGVRAVGMKPVAAGAIDTPAGARNDDALALIAASHGEPRYEVVNPYLFTPPIAPHLAAAEVGVDIDFRRIERCHAELARSHEVVVVEGAGGFLVPLGPRLDMGDLAQALGAAVVLVVGLRLGCLNHALLTAAAIRARGLALVGWIGSRVDPDFASLEGNIATLDDRLGCARWGIIQFRALSRQIEDISDLDWPAIDSFLRA